MSNSVVQLAAHWEIPEWVPAFLNARADVGTDEIAQMQLVIELARENILQNTGGPFAAAVFDRENGELISIGVNMVTHVGNSCAHAEIVALSAAQSRLGNFDLSSFGQYSLVSSTEPCAMCLGALPWSGIAHLVCGANAADAEAIGFDEGQKPQPFTVALDAAGITYSLDVAREQARDIFTLYQQHGGLIYNSGTP